MSACSPRIWRGAPADCRTPVRVDGAAGKAVVFATEDVVVGDSERWLEDGVRDVPHPGERIAAGRPICTVLASAATPEEVRAQLEERAALLEAVASG